MKGKKKTLLVICALLSVIVITVGVSFAFFNYAKLGSTENSITSGSITFLYTEVDKVGAGIKLENAIPMTDTAGKMLTGNGNVFNFKVTSTTNMDASIPYEVTARMKNDSTLDKDVVKVYLTKGETEEEVLLDKYSNLTQTERVLESVAIEKTIYKGKVPSKTENYEENFKLRMWIDSETDFSPVEENGEVVYPYNNKTFTLMVNVYADAKIISQEEVDMENSTSIEVITAGENILTEVTNKDYQYEITLPEGTTSTTLNVETLNPNSKVEIEKVDGLANANNVVRLATAKTVSLAPGNNYFKVTVISENKKEEKEFVLRVIVTESTNIFGKKYEIVPNTPTLTTSFNNGKDASGLYKSTATNNGLPTYYFRGNIDDNYVDFAGLTWRIVRINEDGTIRLIMQDGIENNKVYQFNSNSSDYTKMYYSNSAVKTTLENWYTTNITNKGYSGKVASGNYYCEQAKVTPNEEYLSGAASMTFFTKYQPDFLCKTDKNNKGLISSNIGLLTYEETVYAGAYYQNSDNTKLYLYNGTDYWTMSPAGVSHQNSLPCVWKIVTNGTIYYPFAITNQFTLRPVINLKPNVEVTGSGTSTDHWIVQ